MRRRDFIAALGGATAWPLAARAQSNRVRRIGVITPYEETDPNETTNISAFTKALADLGWTDDRNLRINVRWVVDNDNAPRFAKELIDLQPDVILAVSTPQVAALQREARAIPIVFVVVSDPIGSGFVDGLPRPGGNITGFIPWEPTMAGKWVQLLAEIAPEIKRIAAMFNPDTAPYVHSTYLPSFEGAARLFGIEPIAAPIRGDADIEMMIRSLAGEPRGGFVSMPDAFGAQAQHRAAIISLATRYKVPGVFQELRFVREGGLLSYGPDFPDMYRRAASYVDRILRGAKPADLPVQLPVKFETALNLKTAKALGLEVPAVTLLRADEVIE